MSSEPEQPLAAGTGEVDTTASPLSGDPSGDASGNLPGDTDTAPSRNGSSTPAGNSVPSEEEEEQDPALDYIVVGVGSSAGGLVAFRELLEQLPSETGMSFVLVPHLAPDQTSYLKEINEQYTRMPVLRIEHGQRPEPNRLYILQPNQVARLEQGRFHVEPRPAGERFHRPIDLFFGSLGADQRQHAIGVVLSGADSDGALGLRNIKGEGGVAIVQSPESAQHSSMPRSSIQADHVDMVLPPGAIAIELARLAAEFNRQDIRVLERGRPLQAEEEHFVRIISLLRTFSGMDLRQYKQDTLRRRMPGAWSCCAWSL